MERKEPYRIIISCGGTGGHIYPAIAVANRLKELYTDCEILFVGAMGKMEMQKVPEAGYVVEGLWISGLQRKLTIDNLSFPLKVLSSILKAKRIFKNFKPHAAIGFGGYASGPMLWVASGKGVPTLIQEQNSYAGLTNKWLASRVQRICVAYENMDRFFPAEKVVFTGNPVRSDIVNSDDKRSKALDFFDLDPQKPVVLAIGGSLGARTINQSILASAAMFEKEGIQ
ncbi:MAG: glycosyltransferase, partial [Cyclobacteriaceae bacterium]